MAKLQQLGMTSAEEVKLTSMRDYVVKLARAISRYAAVLNQDTQVARADAPEASHPGSAWRLSQTR